MAETEDSREKRLARKRAWRAANREKVRAQKRAWHAENGKEAYRKNSEKLRARSRAWRADNPEKAKETERKTDAKRSGQPRYVYKGHKSSARQRGVAFLLTFEEWWGIWDASGKWEERGRETGRYVMARLGDVGPYERGNVRICTSSENNSEGHRGKQVSDATRKRLSEIAKARGPINENQRAALARGREMQRHLRPPLRT